MEYQLAAALAAFGIVIILRSPQSINESDDVRQLARGNAYLDLLSIGGQTPLVPPLPGEIDGPVAGGIAKHGRFEGQS
jgi:hypothetical protein